MTLFYCPPCFLDHETGSHPERADRIRLLPGRLGQAGLLERCRAVDFKPVSRQRLARVHSPAYIDEVWAFAKSGGGYLEADTIVSPASRSRPGNNRIRSDRSGWPPVSWSRKQGGQYSKVIGSLPYHSL